MTEIEPRIKPLVDALNQTGLVQTFSSCEGHFEPHEQQLTDRNHAYVQFVPADGVVMADVESWLGKLLIRFKEQHGLLPVTLTGYKRYTPVEDAIEETFVLELRPFNRFDPPARKRADIDRAVAQVRTLIQASLYVNVKKNACMSLFSHITADPAILGGKPCLAGTRISVELVMEWVASGATPDAIVAKYPHLAKEAVQEAIRYAALSVKNEVLLEVKMAA